MRPNHGQKQSKATSKQVMATNFMVSAIIAGWSVFVLRQTIAAYFFKESRIVDLIRRLTYNPVGP